MGLFAGHKTVILRHDVDRLPGNALVIARIEKEIGVKASYYFRIVKKSYDENVIRQIAEMGQSGFWDNHLPPDLWP